MRGTIFRALVAKSGTAVFALFRGALSVTDNFGNSLELPPGRLVAATKKGLQQPQAIPPSIKPAPRPNSKAGKKSVQGESFLTCVPDTATPNSYICTTE